MNEIEVFTDGACRGNPGVGGWGVLFIIDGEETTLYGGEENTTNNRMELLAVIVALEKIKKENQRVHIYTDSKYVSESVEKKWVFNWKKKGFKNKKNPDLWLRFLKIYNKHEIKFIWVKGHNNNPLNERCDYLAVEASKSLELSIDIEYEK